jgi:type II secretory pathway component HofQ
MGLLLFSPRIAFKNKEHKPLAVRHIAMTVSPPAAPVKTAQAPAAPKAAPRPTPKKVSTPQPQPAPKKQQPVVQNSALAALAKELEKNIAHMETGAVQRKFTPAQKGARLQIDLQEESANDYVPVLTHFLHTALHLPDFGAVKMQLTVRRDGSVAKLLVLKTESEENRKYLETQIPLLRFPPLQGEYAKSGEHVFVLTFCNE